MKKAESKGWGQRWLGAGDLRAVEPRVLAAAMEADHFLLDLSDNTGFRPATTVSKLSIDASYVLFIFMVRGKRRLSWSDKAIYIKLIEDIEFGDNNCIPI